MAEVYSPVVETAREYYNSDDADNFYFYIWGGEDIHVGIYHDKTEDIAAASTRTVQTMADQLADRPDGLDESHRVIDLGSGYGGSARVLARRFACHVSCLNLSETQNRRNRELTGQQQLGSHIEVIDGSFESIPMEHDQFHVAWSQDAILHSGNRAGVLAQVDRVLKPGGDFIFTDPMQADDCPPGVLQPVLDRIHLQSLGSFGFYREQARRLGWQEVSVTDMTPQLVNHYTRVRQVLESGRQRLAGKVSEAYLDRMHQGLGHWIEAGEHGYLAWGIMHFRKPR